MKISLKFRRLIKDNRTGVLLPDDTLQDIIEIPVNISLKEYGKIEKMLDMNVPHEFSNSRIHDVLIEFLGE